MIKTCNSIFSPFRFYEYLNKMVYFVLLFIVNKAIAQNNVGIGTLTTTASALLDLELNGCNIKSYYP